jgi:hypothetical protein
MEIVWAEFLDEIGEPFVSDWWEAGFMGGISCRPGSVTADGGTIDEHWHVIFANRVFSTASDVTGRVWVDKQTGHCNVWVNEDYEPREKTCYRTAY